MNRFVILTFVNMGGAEQNPMFGVRDRRQQGEDKKHCNYPMGVLFQHALSSTITSAAEQARGKRAEPKTCESAGSSARWGDE
jgi:hypothetical protein